MSETPTPVKVQIKRRGLALPPRGQALARLQDLEQDLEEEAKQDPSAAESMASEQPSGEVSNAVHTASSNAVIHEGSTSVLTDVHSERAGGALVQAASANLTPSSLAQGIATTAASSPEAGSGHHPQVQVIREPTTRITVDMPDSLHRKISLLSVETRRSIKALVIEALAATYFGTDEHRA